jgi:hypothetical protein
MPDNSIAVLRMESGPTRAKLYIEHIMMDMAIREIVDPLKRIYTELGAAQSFVDTIGVEQGSGLTVNLLIDHPIAEWLEYGTDPHIIQAKDPENQLLHFQYRKTSKWFDSHANDSGDWVEAFEVEHPGFPGYQILAIMLETLIQNYTYAVITKTNAFLQRSKMK